MQQISKPKVCLVGVREALDLAYPPAHRHQLEAKVEVLYPSFVGEEWRRFSGMASRVEFILSTWGMPVLDAAFLDAFSSLKAVYYAAGSVKSFVTEESFRRGIRIFSAQEANAIPVAEYAVSVIMLSLKRFWQHAYLSRYARQWSRLEVTGAYGGVVGLVSLGAVGRMTASKLQGYDLQILACDPYVSLEEAASLGVEQVGLDELFARSDVVSLHCPLIPETEGMIGDWHLRAMKTGATLVNTSRGGIINELEMCEVLRDRPDITAVLDVAHCEPPLAASPLYDLPNVVLTPHISGSMGNEITRMGNWMTEELFRTLDGLPTRHEVVETALSRSA
jgi:phosphoglycerate dehydrogenase-like enzyme